LKQVASEEETSGSWLSYAVDNPRHDDRGNAEIDSDSVNYKSKNLIKIFNISNIKYYLPYFILSKI
jgi:hypothetical protein